MVAIGIGILLAVFIPIYLLIFQPVFRRLAFRQAIRRPRETVLIIVGAMLGTALITGSLILGDGLSASIRHSAYTQLGPVDEVIRAPIFFNITDVYSRAKRLNQEHIDGVLPAIGGTGAVRLQGDLASAEPSVQLLEVDFAQAERFGSDPKATGLRGISPGPHEVDLSEDLAKKLGAHVGDGVLVNMYGTEKVFKVNDILPRKGIAGLLRLDVLSSASSSYNVFLPPGTMEIPYINSIRGIAGPDNFSLDQLKSQKPSADDINALKSLFQGSGGQKKFVIPPSALVFISNDGGVINSEKQGKRVVAELNCSLSKGGSTAGCSRSQLSLRPDYDVLVLTIKSDLIRAADEYGKGFTELFSALAAFSVIAGIFLLITILIMLAQDRKSQHGIMRALGMTGWSLSQAFYLEGWVYAVVSCFAGALFGIVVGEATVLLTRGLFRNTGGAFSLDIVFAMQLTTVLKGFAIGLGVSLLTTVAISVWTSRLNIIRAIRDIPDSDYVKRGWVSTAVGGVIVGAGLWFLRISVEGKNDTGLILAPAIITVGLYFLLRRFISSRLLLSTLSVLIFFWNMFGAYWRYPEIIHDVQIPFFITSGLVTVFATIMFLAVNQRLIGAGVALFARRSNLSTRIGFAYPNARRVRTGLIIGMYALVIFGLAFVTIYSVLFSYQVGNFTKDFSSGYDLLVDGNASSPFVASDFNSINGVQDFAFRSNDTLKFRTQNAKRYTTGQTVALFDDHAKVTIDKRLSNYSSNEAVLKALLEKPNTAIVDERFLQTNGGPSSLNAPLGSTIDVISPVTGRPATLKVIAFSSVNFGESPAYVSAATLRSINGTAVANRALIKLQKGEDLDVVARRIHSQLASKGVEVHSFRSIVNDHVNGQLQLLHLFQGYIALGLFIGIAGLGVVMVRSVRERSRQIGMLRSMGFTSGAVRHIFEIESAFVALEGILTGIVVGTLLVWRLNSSKAFGGSIAFSIPFLQLAILGGVSLIASLLATAAPAQRASKIEPAAALRLID
jgi:putative ABC transport system permease protein